MHNGVIEYPWMELFGKGNTLQNTHGISKVLRDAVFLGGGFMLPEDLAVEADEELKIDVADCLDFEIFPTQCIDEVNEMFANLGEVYGNKPKSLAHLMFNT